MFFLKILKYDYFLNKKKTIIQLKMFKLRNKKNILINKKYLCGRNLTGRQTVFTKKSKNKFLTILTKPFNLNINCLLLINLVINFKLKKIYNILYSNIMKISHELVTNYKPFIFIINYYIFNINMDFFKLIVFFNVNDTICLISTNYNLIKFIKSPGTYGVIKKKNIKLQKVLVLLPSYFYKVFNFFKNFGRKGKIFFNKNKYIWNFKTGYLKNFGKKQINKGIKMNPIDHPHGGKTRTIKYPRTPWGLTTKF